jgi:hypothetical protein
MRPNLVGDVVVEGTGMRLLLNPQYAKILENQVTLDLQFARQNVDSYVTHSVFLKLSLVSRRSPQHRLPPSAARNLCGLTG